MTDEQQEADSRSGASVSNFVTDVREGRVPAWLSTSAAVGWRLIVVVVVLFGLSIAMRRLQVIVLPLLFALLLAAVLAPAARWLSKRGLPSIVSTWLVLLTGAVLIGLVGWFVVPRLVDGFADIGSALEDAYGDIRTWVVEGPIGLEAQTVDDAEERVLEQARTLLETGFTDTATLVVEVITAFFLTLVITFFYVKDGVKFRDGFVSLLPERDRNRAIRATQDGWWVIQRYLLGVVVVGAADALLIGLGLLIIGVPHIIPVMVLTFLAAFFPMVGAILAGSVAALLALASNGVIAALIVVGLTVLVQQLDGDVIAPIVYSRAIDLHPLAILLALTAGAIVAGVVGAFLAVPVLAVGIAMTRTWRSGQRRTSTD